tara:strand:- start:297 stop:554 length:258 start_codon:yes stop_codon:yes gene_type:complete
MLGIPILGGVGIKTAIAKKIDKKARKKMQEALPAVLKALGGGMPRLKDTDRPADEMPLKRLNWFNHGHPKTKNNAPQNFKPGNKK